MKNLESEPWILLVIENQDAVTKISADKKATAALKNIVNKYRSMKVMVLFTNIENTSISFSAPEVLKLIKESQRYLVFEDANSIKLCDLTVSTVRKYAKPIENGDAYFITENDLIKLKTVKL